MGGLFQREAFTGFGPARLWPGVVPPTFTTKARSSGRLRKAVRRRCPHLPGVYGMVDAAGELIYVGKAKSLRRRLLGYFRPNSRDDKAEKIIREARGLIWELAGSEFAALLRKLELIRRWQPRFNVQGQPRRHRRSYVCIGRKPAMYAFVAGKPPATAAACFGPVPGMRSAREAVRRLNDWFRLHNCPRSQTMVFADQGELFALDLAPGCIRHDIGQCFGPCAAACTHAEYAFNVAATLDFLHGKDKTPLDQLQREMNEAAVALEFERAAVLRDRLDALAWLWRHLERLRQAVRSSFIYPVAGSEGIVSWYLIHHGLVQVVIPALSANPDDQESRQFARGKLEEVYQNGPTVPGPPGLDEVDGVLLVAGWFQRHREDRACVIEPEKARQALIEQPRAETISIGREAICS